MGISPGEVMDAAPAEHIPLLRRLGRMGLIIVLLGSLILLVLYLVHSWSPPSPLSARLLRPITPADAAAALARMTASGGVGASAFEIEITNTGAMPIYLHDGMLYNLVAHEAPVDIGKNA